MPEIFEGDPKGSGVRIGIVVSRFNEPVTEKLLEGAMNFLSKSGVNEKDVKIYKVPGAFEIPPVANRLARSGKFDGVICLGAVIRGETAHYEHISREVSSGISRVMMETGLPIGFGVLTTENTEQALMRAEPNGLNRGGDAARATLEMADLLKGFSS